MLSSHSPAVPASSPTVRAGPVARAPYSYREDPDVPSFADDRPIIVFDGFCALCSGFASFVLRHDRPGRFRLLTAQSTVGQALYRHYGLDPVDYETNLLLCDGRLFTKSEGSIRMAEALGLPWSLAGAARILPLGIRDRLYEWVARNRLRWFGVRTVCRRPTPEEQDRFLG